MSVSAGPEEALRTLVLGVPKGFRYSEADRVLRAHIEIRDSRGVALRSRVRLRDGLLRIAFTRPVTGAEMMIGGGAIRVDAGMRKMLRNRQDSKVGLPFAVNGSPLRSLRVSID
jgi:hypothetical protein